MKKLLTLLCLSFAFSLSAQQQMQKITPRAIPLKDVPGRYKDIVTISLMKYEEVQVISTSATEIVFTHERGIVTAKFDDMPAEIQKAYGYDPAVIAPLTPAQKKKKRDEAIAAIAKNPMRARVVVEGVMRGKTVCRIYLPAIEQTKGRNTSGYIMKEVISQQGEQAVLVDGGKRPAGYDLGIVSLYPCGGAGLDGRVYALKPEAAYEALHPKP
jgi:hypothetical protein